MLKLTNIHPTTHTNRMGKSCFKTTAARKSVQKTALKEPNKTTITYYVKKTNAKFIIDERRILGEGTFGTVHKARYKDNTSPSIDVAVKILKHTKDKDGLPAEILREISILKQSSHPNIVKLIDVNIKMLNNQPILFHLAFECLEEDLSTYLKRCQKKDMPMSKVKSLLFMLLKGVKFLHDNQIMHRDLKPANLLLGTNGILKIADLGISRKFSLSQRTYTHSVTTLWYRAPEILLGKKTDVHNECVYGPAIDIWSCGAIFIQLINLAAVWPGDSEIDQMYRIFRTMGTPNETNWPGVTNLPDYKSTFPNWSLNLNQVVPSLDAKGIDLLQQMLVYKFEKRINAKNATNNSWFDEVVTHTDENPQIESVTNNISFQYRKAPNTDFLTAFQTDINPDMRAILVDWLVEVQLEFKLRDLTLYSAMHFVDCYLEKSQIKRHKLQLLGCTCMLLAAKMEEIYGPDIDDFVYISDNTYTHNQFEKMESKVCKILDFDLLVFDTSYCFLSRYLQIGTTDVKGEENVKKFCLLAKYVTELALQKYDMFRYPPALIASSAISLSRRTMNITPAVLSTDTRKYTTKQLVQCERALSRLHQQANRDELCSIYKKYSASKLLHVAKIKPYNGSYSLLPTVLPTMLPTMLPGVVLDVATKFLVGKVAKKGISKGKVTSPTSVTRICQVHVAVTEDVSYFPSLATTAILHHGGQRREKELHRP